MINLPVTKWSSLAKTEYGIVKCTSKCTFYICIYIHIYTFILKLGWDLFALFIKNTLKVTEWKHIGVEHEINVTFKKWL